MSLASLPTALIVPPVNLLAAACAGALLRRRRLGRALLAVGLGGLLVLALPAVSARLLLLAERGLNQPVPPGLPPQAVVILSGDQQAALGDGNVLTTHVGPLTLEREAAGAMLARRTGLPVLVAGGAIRAWSPPLADMMAASLQEVFGITVRWREARSQDTLQNARYSAAILQADGIGRVWLVTHAWHMRRALLAFRRAGLDPVPAPVQLDAARPLTAGAFIPSAEAWLQSYLALHELIGLAWYTMRP